MRGFEGLVGGGASGFAAGGEVRVRRHMAPLRGRDAPEGMALHMLPVEGDDRAIPQAVYQVPYTPEEREEVADQVTIVPAGVGQRRPVALGGRDYEGRMTPEAADALRGIVDFFVPQSPAEVAATVAVPALGGPLARAFGRGLVAAGLGSWKRRGPVAAGIAALEPSEGEAGPLRRGLGAGIRAFHGSPHEFDRFDISRIGTGEGAQAYGHGLYFAENEGVARSYRDALSPGEFRAQGLSRDAESWLLRTQQEVPGLRPDDVAEYARRLRDPFDDAAQGSVIADEIEAAIGDGRLSFQPRGHMYEVRLHVDPDSLMHWDRPLPDQPARVREVLGDLGFRPGAVEERAAYLASLPNDDIRGLAERMLAARDLSADEHWAGWERLLREAPGIDHNAIYDIRRAAERPDGWGITGAPPTGQDFYIDLGGPGISKPARATAALREAGIPGIRYLDAGSRAAGEGTSNFVMFDDEPIEILRRYYRGGLADAPVEDLQDGGRVGLLRRGLGALADGIRAYHGSPHEFDRFDISRIGTGEGAQAYGHGLYFAGDEAVARHYRDALNTGSEVAGSLNRFINTNAGYLRSPEEVAERLEAWGRLRSAPRGFADAAANPEVRDLVSRLVLEQAPVEFGAPVAGDVARLYGRLDDAVRQAGPRGHMYEVRLHADPEALLDWDQPLRRQVGRMDQVREALPLPRPEDYEARQLERMPSERDAWALFRRDGEGEVHLPGTYASESAARRGLDRLGRVGRDAILHPDDFTVTGEEAHRRLMGAWGAPDVAASRLLEVGVPGVRYLDAGSRRFGDGTHNFVMFDDEPVEILRRYARGGLADAPVQGLQDGGRVGLLRRGLGALLRAAEDGGAGGARRGRRWTPPDEVVENLPLVDPVEPLRVEGDDIRQRGLAAADWMTENLVGQRIPAEGIDNREVLITGNLPGKVRSHISDPLIAGLPGIPQVIARGAPYSPPMPPMPPEQGVLRFHYLGARVPVGEQVDPWRVVVREEHDGRLLTHDAGSLGRARRPRATGERASEGPLSAPALQGRGQRSADDVMQGRDVNPGSGDDLDESWTGYARGGMPGRGFEGLVHGRAAGRYAEGGLTAAPLSGAPGPEDELATTNVATERGLAQASQMWAQAGNVLRTGGLGALAPAG